MKDMMKPLRVWMVCIAVAALVALPAATQAQFTEKIRSGVTQTNQELGYSETPLQVIIGNVIRVAITLVGVVLLLLLLYAGFLWMTAGGDTEKVKKARGMIFNAIVGMIIIVLAYAITDFVIQQLAGVTGGGAGGTAPAQ
jgi:hypothetical protein